jgi:type III secretion protein J
MMTNVTGDMSLLGALDHLRAGVLRRAMLGLALVSVLTACQTEIYSRVTEREANDMLAVLLASGIDAEKQVVDEKSWRVTVPDEKVAAALEQLRLNGLPQEKYLSIGEVFKKEGLVSTPSEERIRYIYAVSQELSNTLMQIDGVVSARVHVVSPANDPLSPNLKPSSAAVFIKHRADADLQSMAPAVKNLVMRGIEGLTYENISLSIFAAKPTPKPRPEAFINVDNWWKWALGLGFVSLLCLGLVMVIRKKSWQQALLDLSSRFSDWSARVARPKDSTG